MLAHVDGARLFVDVDRSKLVPDGAEMRERPTSSLLHGGSGLDHSSFEIELSMLREELQLVYLDHRGNVRSDRNTPDRWNLDQWGDDVRTVCDIRRSRSAARVIPPRRSTDQVEVVEALPECWVEFHRFTDRGHGVDRDRPDQAIPVICDFVPRAFEGDAAA